MKPCSKCKATKPLTEFYWRKERNTAKSSCKTCDNRDSIKRNRERGYAKTPAAKAAQKKYRSGPARSGLLEKARDSNLKRYGINRELYDDLYELQNGKCPICFDTPKTLHVDHDHTVNVVRGLLCTTCNKALGMLGDDCESLERAANYLTNPPVAALASKIASRLLHQADSASL